jgi:hypothetical protein
MTTRASIDFGVFDEQIPCQPREQMGLFET